jgi:hypothetical protein
MRTHRAAPVAPGWSCSVSEQVSRPHGPEARSLFAANNHVTIMARCPAVRCPAVDVAHEGVILAGGHFLGGGILSEVSLRIRRMPDLAAKWPPNAGVHRPSIETAREAVRGWPRTSPTRPAAAGAPRSSVGGRQRSRGTSRACVQIRSRARAPLDRGPSSASTGTLPVRSGRFSPDPLVSGPTLRDDLRQVSEDRQCPARGPSVEGASALHRPKRPTTNRRCSFHAPTGRGRFRRSGYVC